MHTVHARFEQQKDQDTCGDTSYKAARNATSKFKHMDETGLLMASCRHGVILYAANIFSSENFRYIHYIIKRHKKESSFFVTMLCAVIGDSLKGLQGKYQNLNPSQLKWSHSCLGCMEKLILCHAR